MGSINTEEEQATETDHPIQSLESEPTQSSQGSWLSWLWESEPSQESQSTQPSEAGHPTQQIHTSQLIYSTQPSMSQPGETKSKVLQPKLMQINWWSQSGENENAGPQFGWTEWVVSKEKYQMKQTDKEETVGKDSSGARGGSNSSSVIRTGLTSVCFYFFLYYTVLY